MNIIPQTSIRFAELPHLSEQPSFTTGSHRIQTQTHTHANFSVITAEGDRVSLSTNSASQTNVGTYTAQGVIAGQSVNLTRQQFSTSASSEFNLLIEGDLNEQEEKDIQRFVQSSKQILQEFLNGDFNTLSESASAFEELSTLARADVSLRHSVSVSSIQRFTSLTPLTNAPLQEHDSRGTGPARKPHSLIQTVLDRIQKVQEKLQADSATLLKRVPLLLSNLIQGLQQDPNLNDDQKHSLQSLQKELLKPILKSLHPPHLQERNGSTLEDSDQGHGLFQDGTGNRNQIDRISPPLQREPIDTPVS